MSSSRPRDHHDDDDDIMVSLAIIRRLCRDVHPRWFNRLVTLVVRLYRFSAKRADLRCTFSVFVICPSLYGSSDVAYLRSAIIVYTRDTTLV